MKQHNKILIKKQIENLDFEISFFEGIIKNNPDYADALIPLGDAYTKRGYYEKGLEVDLKLSSLLPKDPVVHYNLACSYSLLGKIDLSLDALEKALSLGYEDLKWMNKDPDLENARKDIRYKNLIKNSAKEFKPSSNAQ